MPRKLTHQKEQGRLCTVHMDIPLWYASVFEAMRSLIRSDFQTIDDAYTSTSAKRDAARIEKIIFVRPCPTRGTTSHSFPAPASKKTREKRIREQVENIVEQRGQDYGDARKNFEDIATLTEPVQECKHPAARVALMMILVKVARLIVNPTHLDSWHDIAGYANCGAYVTENERLEELDQ